jgi:hypothetical protein
MTSALSDAIQVAFTNYLINPTHRKELVFHDVKNVNYVRDLLLSHCKKRPLQAISFYYVLALTQAPLIIEFHDVVQNDTVLLSESHIRENNVKHRAPIWPARI